jgi:type II secretion system protein C
LLRAGIWILNVGLLVACGYIVATSARALVSPPEVPELKVPDPTPVAVRARTFDLYQPIADRELFRGGPKGAAKPAKPAVKRDAKLAESQLHVDVIGTAFASDPALSVALVHDHTANEKLVVRAHDPLAGATVVRIERKRIVVDKNGILEQITLDEETGKQPTKGRAKNQPRARGRSRPSKEEALSGLGKLARKAEQAKRPTRRAPVQSVLTQARIVPRYAEDGQLSGLQLSAIRPGSLLQAAGLENGDLVVGVNGTRVADPAQGLQAFRELSSPDSFVLEVERQGSVVQLQYSPEDQ